MIHKIVHDGARWASIVRHRFGVATLGAFVFVGAPLVAFAGQSMYSQGITPATSESPSAEQFTAGQLRQSNAVTNDSSSAPEPDQPTKTDVSLEVTTKAGQKPEVSARVNGEPVAFSRGGSGTKHIHQNNGQSVVDITVVGEGNASSYVHSSTSIEINGQSHSNSTGSNVSGDEGRHPRRR